MSGMNEGGDRRSRRGPRHVATAGLAVLVTAVIGCTGWYRLHYYIWQAWASVSCSPFRERD